MVRDDLIANYISRFVNRTDVWGKQYVWDGRCQYACQKPDMDTRGGRFFYEPVTAGLVRRHLDGGITCAWAAMTADGSSRWLAFDSDIEDGNLDQLQAFLRQRGWCAIREARRPGRPGHLWLLFDEPVAAAALIVLGDELMKLAGVTALERFPKSASGYSQLRGPLGIHRKPGAEDCRGWFDGPDPDLTTQLGWLAEEPLNSAADARSEAERYRLTSAVLTSTGPLIHHNRHPSMNILELVEWRRFGRELVAQCPLCASEGHDRHRDNLRISPDGSKFCCVYGGPGQVHRGRDIIRQLIARRGLAS